MPNSMDTRRYFIVNGKGRNEIFLEDSIGQGGEATVYTIRHTARMQSDEKKSVAKIYFPTSSKELKAKKTEQKLNLLIDIWKKNRQQLKGICFPKNLITDEKNRCVGFLMRRYQGYSLAKIFQCMEDRRPSSMMWWPPFIKEIYNTWTRVELATLAINIIGKLETLHTMGLLMSDINPSNILIGKNGDVFLIDVDSYQVERYTCPVFRPEFAAPRLARMRSQHGVHITLEDEDYAVAVLIFQILFCGQHPYARSGKDSFDEQIRKREFAYPLAYGSTAGIPVGPWQGIWYSLTPEIQVAFHRVFHRPNDRDYPNTSEWARLLKDYRSALEANTIRREIFPTTDAVLRQKDTFLGYNTDETVTDPSSDPGLRMFETTLRGDRPKEKTLFVEFGSECIRSYAEKEGRWRYRPFKTRHFSYITPNGRMDTGRLADNAQLRGMAAAVHDLPPEITHIRAFGGSCLRLLPNRDQVVATLRQTTGLHFGILTCEEEATLLADMALTMDPSLQKETLLIVDVGGLAAELILRASSGDIKRVTMPRLGRQTLRNWLFSTYPGGNMPATVFSTHDAAIREEISRLPDDVRPTAIVGIGTITSLIPRGHVREELDADGLKNKARELTSFLSSCQREISSLHGKAIEDYNMAAYGNTNLRLALPVYTCIMQHFNINHLTALRFGLGKAYINHFTKYYENEEHHTT